ncbi:MAG: glycoside hydrolase family 3 protein, partial [Spirochaetaceae bacterium]|nr:glycoside hydrolase family 3 protein [Spirochaetaceae bacterium]
NLTWFEKRIKQFENNTEGSMISPTILPLLSFEKDIINNLINSMSLDEKIGQIFILDLKKKSTDKYYLNADDELKNYLDVIKPGGVIFFSDNIKTNSQVADFITELQAITNIPLFIAVDQEGGRVSRLTISQNMDFLKTPALKVLGKTNDSGASWDVGRIIGEQLSILGFNLNFAPVADINSNPDNPVIGDRAFSDNVQTVSKLVKPFIQGLQEAGVCSVIKHFPGHGDTQADPHSGEVSVNTTLDKLNNYQFVPFREGISQGAAAVMIAHIKTPGIAETMGLPASVSPFFLKNILREQIGFTGIIISDSFSMGAIKNYWSPYESAKMFISAGGDMILRPVDAAAAKKGIYQAIIEGRISEERLNESIFRILAVKLRFGFFLDDYKPGELNMDKDKIIIDNINKEYERLNGKT